MKKKILFISDLDGTFMRPDGTISSFSKDVINSLAGSDFGFTASSARTPSTMTKIVEGIDFAAPAVVLNGTAMYDFTKREYSEIEVMSEDAVRRIVEIVDKYDLHGYFYSIKEDNIISAFYTGELNPSEQNFMDKRLANTGKRFVRVDSASECLSHKISYFTNAGEKESTMKAAEEFRKIEGIHVEHYHNVYTENEWYLELCPATASKRNGIKKLREMYGFERIIAFGDNTNDIPMFEEADESYAVGNAKEEAKKAAGAVIEKNSEDGVAKQILRICERYKG